MYLKKKLFTGSVNLLLLTFLNSVISFSVLIIAVNQLGLNEYGLYAGAFVILNFTQIVFKFDIKVLLAKYEYDKEEDIFNTVFTVLLILSFVVVILISVILNQVSLPELYLVFQRPILLLILLLPINILTEIPRAVLERRAELGLIARQEFFASFLNHIITLFLLIVYPSYLSLVIGYTSYCIIIFIVSWYSSHLVPRISIDKYYLKVISQYCRHVFFQNILFQSKRLVNPFVVGYFFGSSGVGIISFAEKIVQSLNFYRNSLHRFTNSSVSQLEIKNDNQLINFLKKGTFLQILPIGLILLLGSGLVYVVSLFTQSEEWVWLNYLYPFLASGFLFYILLTIPIIMMQMYFKISDLTWFYLIYNVAFIIINIILLELFGLIGYGIAELLTIPFYYLIIRSLQKNIGPFITNEMIALLICIIIALHWYYIGLFAFISLISLALIPVLKKQYLATWNQVTNDNIAP